MKNFICRPQGKLLMAALIAVSLFIGCRKPALESGPRKSQTQTAQVPLTISMEEIYARLPQTVMHNLANDVKCYVGQAEWRYEADYLIVRIPLNQSANKSYLYAVRPYNDPTGAPHVYLSQFFPAQESKPGDFTGKQIWLNLQEWKVYGVQYEHNAATAFMNPILINPKWEATMYNAGLFYLDNNGMISVHDDPANDVYMQTMGGDNGGPGGPRSHGDDLIGPGKGSGFFGWLFGGLSDIINGIGDFLGGGESGGASNDNGDDWWPNWPGGADYGGGGVPPPPPGSHGGGGGTPPYVPPPSPPVINIWDNNLANGVVWATLDNPGANNHNNNTIPVLVNGQALDPTATNQVYLIDNPAVSYVRNTLGLDQTQTNWLLTHLDETNAIKEFLIVYVPGINQHQKIDIAREHLMMMIGNPSYLTQIHNFPGHWWDQDQHGFIIARKIQMDYYLQSNPYLTLDCHDLIGLENHWANWHDVAAYQLPASVQQRIINIRAQFPSRYTYDAFYQLDIQSADGAVVNCDFFAIHISQLPFDSYGYTRMTSDQFLDFFRQNIDMLDNIGNNTATNYSYYNDPGYLNDYTQFYAGYESSIGSLAHFYNPADLSGYIAYNDGTVIESGFDRSTVHKWFMYTTMKSPADGSHPVSGNRRFGILPDAANGGYLLYVRGVDRTTDPFTTTINDAFGSVFNGADGLWLSEMHGAINYIQQHGGSANEYSTGGVVKKRIEWSGPLGQYLKGQISIDNLKTLNGCE